LLAAALAGVFAVRWLLVAAGVVIAVGGFIWGGTNNAQAHCLAHRFGDNSFVSTMACVFQH
jgi:hypothetical protein